MDVKKGAGVKSYYICNKICLTRLTADIFQYVKMRLVVVDAGARCSELGPHVHVESVDHLTTCVKGCFFGPIGVDGMIMSKRWHHTFHCPHMFIPQGASKVACGRISTGMLYSSREEEIGRERRKTERERENLPKKITCYHSKL